MLAGMFLHDVVEEPIQSYFWFILTGFQWIKFKLVNEIRLLDHRGYLGEEGIELFEEVRDSASPRRVTPTCWFLLHQNRKPTKIGYTLSGLDQSSVNFAHACTNVRTKKTRSVGEPGDRQVLSNDIPTVNVHLPRPIRRLTITAETTSVEFSFKIRRTWSTYWASEGPGVVKWPWRVGDRRPVEHYDSLTRCRQGVDADNNRRDLFVHRSHTIVLKTL